MDDASGRGWGAIEDDGALAGRIYFHQGDDSAFTAVRTTGRQGVAAQIRAPKAVRSAATSDEFLNRRLARPARVRIQTDPDVRETSRPRRSTAYRPATRPAGSGDRNSSEV